VNPDIDTAPPRQDEDRRLAVLHALQVLDTEPEPVFDAIVASAAQVCGVPQALISLIDHERQWFKASVGMAGQDQTPRDIAFCDHTIRNDCLLQVPDATADARFRANPMVTGDTHLRFYAGAPIVMPGGERIGAVCVLDNTPRRLDEHQCAMLEGLAAIAATSLRQRRAMLDVAHRLAASEAHYRAIAEEHRLSEERLARSEQRLRGLYEATPAILHSIDAQGRLIDVSDRWLALLGYTRDEVVGRPSSDFLSPASQTKARECVLPEFFRTGACDRVEYEFVHRDGHLVDVLLSATLERDAQGAPLRSLAVLEDLTAQKQLRAELGLTHALLDVVIDNLPALVGYWDAGAVTRFANRDLQAAMGLPLDRLIGCGLAQVFESVDPRGYAQIAPHVDAVLAGRRQEFECGLLTVSGLRQMRVTLVPVQPEPGRIDGFHGTFFDITGMKSLELRQRDSERRYRALSEHLDSAYALFEIVADDAGRAVDLRLMQANKPCRALFGLDAEPLIDARAATLFRRLGEDPAEWVALLGRVAVSGESLQARRARRARGASGHRLDVIAFRTVPGQLAVLMREVAAALAAA